MKRWLWQASISFSWLIQYSYSGSNPIYYSRLSLVQNTMCCCLEYIDTYDSAFECEWATNLLEWRFVDRWIRRGRFLRLDEWREGKCFSSGGNWLDEGLETYLICVLHWHGWISIFNEFWLFKSEADQRRWKIWSRDIQIRYPANVDKFCTRNNPIVEEVEPEYWFCVFVWVFLLTVISSIGHLY